MRSANAAQWKLWEYFRGHLRNKGLGSILAVQVWRADLVSEEALKSSLPNISDHRPCLSDESHLENNWVEEYMKVTVRI